MPAQRTRKKLQVALVFTLTSFVSLLSLALALALLEAVAQASTSSFCPCPSHRYGRAPPKKSPYCQKPNHMCPLRSARGLASWRFPSDWMCSRYRQTSSTGACGCPQHQTPHLPNGCPHAACRTHHWASGVLTPPQELFPQI